MCRIKQKKFFLVLLLIGISCLNSCTTANSDICPVWPIAGPDVATDLQTFEGKNFWEWMGRADKLRQQLELCNQK